MKLYHRTNCTAAAFILKEGFKKRIPVRDNRIKGFDDDDPNCFWGLYWLAERPADNDDVPHDANTVLEIDIPEEIVISHEYAENEKPYRVFTFRSEILNSYKDTIKDVTGDWPKPHQSPLSSK